MQADSNIPKTADETQMAAWMLAALLSLAGGSVLMRRKGEGTK
ncbi:MAG: LPXTG cell wall anchor domain-containing protein [Oscillospiraceae bacterium]